LKSARSESPSHNLNLNIKTNLAAASGGVLSPPSPSSIPSRSGASTPVDQSLEKGVSASCQTFGNEPLSDEGVKFDILGVEVWYVGS
jgi:hypothetical protein